MILAVQTTEITACAGNRQACRAWMELVERLLLYRVDGQRTRFSIYLANEYAMMVTATATASGPAIGNPTVMRTEQTLHYPIALLLIVSTLYFFCHG